MIDLTAVPRGTMTGIDSQICVQILEITVDHSSITGAIGIQLYNRKYRHILLTWRGRFTNNRSISKLNTV
jgi:hypothetical protein